MPRNEPADQEPTTAELLEMRTAKRSAGAAKRSGTAAEKAVVAAERAAEAAQATVDADDAADVADKTDMSAVGDDGQVFGG